MPLTDGEALTAYSFELTLDGQAIPNVVAINNITQSVQTIETKSMSPAGQYVITQMMGPRQSGQLQVTCLATGDPAVTQWFLQGRSGDFKGARKTASLVYKTPDGTPIQTIEFSDVMVTGVSYGELKAGEPTGVTYTLSMTFSDMTVG
jgi:phage tail-like protein